MKLQKIDEEKSYLLEVVLFFLIMEVVFIGLVSFFFDGLSMINSFFLGTLIWSVIYFFFLFDRFWIILEPNHRIVLQNYFVRDIEMDELTMTTGLFIPKGQRSSTSIIVAKLPWEKPVGKPISTMIQNTLGTKIEVLDMHNRLYTVEWQAPLSPVPGRFLPRYLLISDEDAKKFFTGIFESYIQTEFKKIDGSVAMGMISEFRERFKTCLKGDEIADEERRMARYTNTPIISSIIEGRESQQADQVSKLAQQTAAALEQLTAKGVEADNALTALLLLQGKNVDLAADNITVKGLENASGNVLLGSEMLDRSNRRKRRNR